MLRLDVVELTLWSRSFIYPKLQTAHTGLRPPVEHTRRNYPVPGGFQFVCPAFDSEYAAGTSGSQQLNGTNLDFQVLLRVTAPSINFVKGA